MAKKALKTVNIALPPWLIQNLDQEAKRLGISRKATINILLAASFQHKERSPALPEEYLLSLDAVLSKEWLSQEDDEASHDL